MASIHQTELVRESKVNATDFFLCFWWFKASVSGRKSRVKCSIYIYKYIRMVALVGQWSNQHRMAGTDGKYDRTFRKVSRGALRGSHTKSARH